ncbi:hypothetical protein [Aureimonas sp. AU4]|uniref:hypothetical protein n=1 Tax=Aureimonas sp. AU4 TaxID=1638163 RepID=UPI00178CC7D1|nr:hypothetical protein [Aureimonas sp. AU4]
MTQALDGHARVVPQQRDGRGGVPGFGSLAGRAVKEGVGKGEGQRADDVLDPSVVHRRLIDARRMEIHAIMIYASSTQKGVVL